VGPAAPIAFFLVFHQPEDTAIALTAAELDRLAACLKTVRDLRRALIFTPDTTDDPYLDRAPPPALAIQLYFAEIAAMEAALGGSSALHALADTAQFPSLAGAPATQQAMLTRAFAVPDAAPTPPPGVAQCTYLVSYEGAAENPHDWLTHYLRHHPPLMVRLPGVRAVEVYTRLDWCAALPWPRVAHLQRNKVVFNDGAALRAALASPIRQAMRADFHRLPPYRGPVRHDAMATVAVALDRVRGA